jgi:hypothetical protein
MTLNRPARERNLSKPRNAGQPMSNPLLSRIFSPTVLLYAFAITSEIGDGFYVVTEGEPPRAFTVASGIGFLWILGWWLYRDSRLRSTPWIYDMGMFLYILWPFIMPYHLIKTRGAWGLLGILGFVGAYIGGLVVGATVAELLVQGIV